MPGAATGWYESRTIPTTKELQRVEELTAFIDLLTTRFKETETLFTSRLEVGPRELVLLRALGEEGPLIARELGARFGVPMSTMTGLVDRMEAKGLVRRVPHRRDRRSIELEVTPAGRAALREQARGLEAIARGMLAALSESDQEALLRILRRLRAAFGAGRNRRTS